MFEDDDVYYWKQLCLLQDALENVNENGLFKNNKDDYQKLVEGVTDAFLDLDKKPPDINQARKKFALLWGELNDRIGAAGLLWRLNYCYCLPIFAYFTIIFFALTALWFVAHASFISFTLFWVPNWAFIWGTIGSILYGFWWLWQNVSHKKFRKVWYVWYFSLPIMGCIFGALAYLVYYAGFIAAAGIPVGTLRTDTNTLAMLFSALAGFSSRWTVNLLEKMTSLIQLGGRDS